MKPEERAPSLAEGQLSLSYPTAYKSKWVDVRAWSKLVAHATRTFQTTTLENASYQRAAEWFLDNHYLVSRTLRQVATEIPEGFQRRLPHVVGDESPRILRIAEALTQWTSLDFDEAGLLSFIEAYQTRAPLTIAELWALPVMLRVATIRTLIHLFEILFATSHSTPATSETPLDPGIGVERVIRVLRLLAEIDWKAFVQKTSAVEATLRDDPAGVYTRMDFETRDAYRKEVEYLAWETRKPEPEVATHAVALAARNIEDPRKAHVGFYLIGGGKEALRELIGFRLKGMDRVRSAMRAHPTLTYVGGIVLSAAALVALAGFAAVRSMGIVPATAVILLSTIPALSLAVALANWAVTKILIPKILPKIEFSTTVSTDCKTVIVIPTLVSRPQDLDELFAQLELHYLSSQDPSLSFALLTDHVDTAAMPDDQDIIAHAEKVVALLNTKYATTSTNPFHLLHRESRWNENEQCFMGWERKRGKLEEFNRFLRGDTTTSFKHHVGDAHGLEDVKFVITLDSDTQLPIGAAKKLIGLAAHPLNRPEIDPETGRVFAGYAIAQPRVEASPVYGKTTLFSRVASGDTALDIYTHAVSDVYQDLFGSGTYVGKGIYDVDAFMESLHDRVPENALVSHDLFEGIHSRVALATDVIVFEHYPRQYLAFTRRMHRWMRGDWQLFPWLFGKVPSARPERLPNRLTIIDRWRIFDNLRRSLLSPALVTLFGILALSLPKETIAAILVPLFVPLAMMAPGVLGPDWKQTLTRWILNIALLPYEGYVAVDAIVRVLVRSLITHKKLLEWVPADASARAVASGKRALFWREMLPSVVLTALLAGALAVLNPWGLIIAAPVLIAWFLAPELARQISADDMPTRTPLPAESSVLRRLARRTWLFFESFVGPGDHWLAPDNFQQEPGAVVAHRTSPTNIGLMLVADLSAYDLGFIGRAQLAALIRNALDTLARLERYRGHWLNWYNTQTLEPLAPKYVSTVDSGNLAASLMVVAEGLRDAASGTQIRAARWQGLIDTLDLMEEALDRLTVSHDEVSARVASTRHTLIRARDDAGRRTSSIQAVTDLELPALQTALLDALERSSARDDVPAFRETRTWLDRLQHQLSTLRVDLDATDASIAEISGELRALAERADIAHAAMDFTFLFDAKRKLFHIGYNATSDRLDLHHYDLLASEARIASFLAVVLKQVPTEHWYTLGRPIARIHGSAALLSWGGTMFEYLMPRLFMRSHPETLLAQTVDLAVAAQIDYGKLMGVPWGISESGFAQLDVQHNYQYRSFGVPGLGLQRSLEDDLVIAPYASMLAVSVRPHEVIENIASFTRMGAMGTYGLFEAIDFHETRGIDGSHASGDTKRDFAIVRSHMAHHQGMILAALNNALSNDVLVSRFHANALVQVGEPLLSEKLPSVSVSEDLARTTKRSAESPPTAVQFYPGWTPERLGPQAAILSNGRLTSVVTDTGAGFTQWNGLAVTRGSLDTTRDVDGTWIYVREKSTGRTWSAAPAPTHARRPHDEVLFQGHEVGFHCRDEGISVRTEIAIAPLNDVEVRYLTLHNESDLTRTLNVASFCEPALEPVAAVASHPAFSRLFVECEVLDDQHGVVASRRPRSPDDAGAFMVQRLVWNEGSVKWLGAETDRGIFLGRRCDARTATLGLRDKDDVAPIATLDPAIALSLEIELAPFARVEIALVTSVAKTRSAALDLSRRFASLHAAKWASQDARREVSRRLDRDGVDPQMLSLAMRMSSRLLFPSSQFKPSKDLISASLPSKSNLWGFRISGDFPLLVVRVHPPAPSPLVFEALALYRMLRTCRIPIELVFVDESPSSYQSNDPDSLQSALISAGAGDWLNQRAGVIVLTSDQIQSADRDRILTAATVLLDTKNGDLAQQLGSGAATSPALPMFSSSRMPDPVAAVTPTVPKLVFETDDGGFTEDYKEYVVKVFHGLSTPAPWCNVLANSEAGCMVSESSLGTTWAGNSGENRLTPWRNDPVSDTPAEAVYLRDEETAEVWSPTPLPAGLGIDTVVRHGAGYTVYESESRGLRQSLTVFVPSEGPVKILKVKLENRTDRQKRLTATYYVEWLLGSTRDNLQSHIITEMDGPTQTILARSRWNDDFADRVAFVVCDRPTHGFTCDRTEFLGRSGSYAQPDALARWGLSGNMNPGIDPCTALQTHIDLSPLETVEFHFILGQGRDRAHAIELAQRFRQPTEVNQAWTALHSYWDALLGAVQVKTPDRSMDLMLNRWLIYQSASSRFLARTGFYQSSGAYGFRDQLQDVMAFVHGSPSWVRGHILESAKHQFEEGDVMHWWHPPMDRGVRTRCSDDMAWLPYVTAHYVNTTGDRGILAEIVPYLNAPPLKPDEHDRYSKFPEATEKGTLLDHCRRALKRAVTEGAHGLPLMGDGDWNDGMNRVGAFGRGESVWLAFFLCATMTDFASLLERENQGEEAQSWRIRAQELRGRIETAAWDGAWYLRAFYDDGAPLGTAQSRSCRIDSIVQSWSVLAGVRDANRCAQALRSADQILIREKDRLVLVLDPPFQGSRHDPGYIATYPAGIRENGGQYTHAATWLGWAHAAIGDGKGAANIFKLLNPVLRTQSTDDIDRYRVEPYVVAGDIYSVSPFVARGGWTWYTGSAAWMWRLGTEAILGLRLRDGTLHVDPCIPPEWPGFEATVRIGKREIHVVVDNSMRAGRGVRSMTMDGVPVTSSRVSLSSKNATSELRVVLGPPDTTNEIVQASGV